VSPAGDAPEYRSGQFISWERIKPTPPIQNIERVSAKGATAYSYHNNGLTDFLRFSGIARANGIECRAPECNGSRLGLWLRTIRRMFTGQTLILTTSNGANTI